MKVTYLRASVALTVLLAVMIIPSGCSRYISDGYPAWSPEGTRIAFTTWHGDNRSDIYIINTDGSGLVRLYQNRLQFW